MDDILSITADTSWRLALVFREKLLKKYSLKTIFRPLVEDLKKLESGVVIDLPVSRKVKCGVLAYAADNLEASTVGGFSACFRDEFKYNFLNSFENKM